MFAHQDDLKVVGGKEFSVKLKDLTEWAEFVHSNTTLSALSNLRLIKRRRRLSNGVYVYLDVVRLEKLWEERKIAEGSTEKQAESEEPKKGAIDFTKLKKCLCGYTTFNDEEYHNHIKDCPTYQFEQNKDAKRRLDES